MTQYNLHDIHLLLTKASALISAEAFVSERWISCKLYCVIELLLDKGRVAENVQRVFLLFYYTFYFLMEETFQQYFADSTLFRYTATKNFKFGILFSRTQDKEIQGEV